MALSPLSNDSSISIVPSSCSSADPSPEISSPSSKPLQRKKTMVWEYSSSPPAVTQPKANSACPSVAADLEIGRFDHVEIVAVPQIGFDDPPAADQFAACHRVGHVTAASSAGARTRL
jgi:hypothetical protein